MCASAVLFCCGAVVTASGEKESLCPTSSTHKDIAIYQSPITLCGAGKSFLGYRLPFPAFAGTARSVPFVCRSESAPVLVLLS